MDKYNLKGNDTAFLAARQKLVNAVEMSLAKRFHDTEESVMRSTRLTKFECWPDMTDQQAVEGLLNTQSVQF